VIADRAASAARALVLALSLLSSATLAADSPAPDTALLDQGRALFERGEGLDPVKALLAGDLEVDGSSMPCASCHGRDGGGGEESGYSPTPLHWSQLTRPYEVTTDSGRVHGPYTPGLLKRAITLGLDSSGNELLNIMPRYTMSLRDLDALTAYIQTLDRPRTGATLRVALPRMVDGPMRAFEDASLETLRAALQRQNQEGGLYGRSIEAIELPVADDATAEDIRDQLDRMRPVALLGGLLPAARDANDTDTAAGALLRSLQLTGVPWIGPRAMGQVRDASVFLLEADLASQATALARWALANESESGSWWIVVGDDPGLVDTAASVETFLRDQDVTPRRVRVADLNPDQIPADANVLLLAPADAFRDRLRSGAARRRWLQPAALTSDALIDALSPNLILATPNWPLRSQLPAWDELRELTPDAARAGNQIGARMSAIAAARVLVRVLSGVGRDASPETLTEALEELHEFDAGLGRPVSFGAGRREANPGAFIFKPELSTAPVWQSVR